MTTSTPPLREAARAIVLSTDQPVRVLLLHPSGPHGVVGIADSIVIVKAVSLQTGWRPMAGFVDERARCIDHERC
ncbi:hypothetical protein OG418_00535 [Streptomyces phaeochromogenes]|uniref:hypothetical protein n=1 Tax=Streptomyces phaeochromogenes TaxID=1923 RepID=UPI003247C2E9